MRGRGMFLLDQYCTLGQVVYPKQHCRECILAEQNIRP